MRARTIERVDLLDVRHIAVACAALIERARRVHASYASASSAERARLCRQHVSTAEALLNLLSVLEAERAPGARALREGTDRVLASARELGMEGESDNREDG